MILGVDKAILLISLEFTHATATDGAGLGLRPGCFVPPLHGRFMGQAWASLQHGVLEFQLLVLFRTGRGSGPASFLLHFYESKQVTSQQMEGKRMHSLPVGGRRHLAGTSVGAESSCPQASLSTLAPGCLTPGPASQISLLQPLGPHLFRSQQLRS